MASTDHSMVVDDLPLRTNVTAVDFRLALQLIIEKAKNLEQTLSYLPPNHPVSYRDVRVLHFLIGDLDASEVAVEHFLATNRDLDIRHTVLTKLIKENTELRNTIQHNENELSQEKHKLPIKTRKVAFIIPEINQKTEDEWRQKLVQQRWPSGLTQCPQCDNKLEGEIGCQFCPNCHKTIIVTDDTILSNPKHKYIPLSCWVLLFKATTNKRAPWGIVPEIAKTYSLKPSYIANTINAIRSEKHPQWLYNAFGVNQPETTQYL